LTIDNLMYW